VPEKAAIEAYVNKEYPVDPEWVQGEEIDENVTDVSSGWDCGRLKKP